MKKEPKLTAWLVKTDDYGGHYFDTEAHAKEFIKKMRINILEPKEITYNCNCGKYQNGGICPHKEKDKPAKK